MHAQRLDLYRNIHKGIRAMLADLVTKSGSADFSDAAEIAKLRAEARDIFELLESHAHNEDQYIMPLLAEASPALHREFTEAHEDQEASLPALLAMLDDANDDQKGHAFVVQFSRVAGELITHMADEEIELNHALWSHFSDEELLAAEQRLVGSIPPEKMARYLRWMLPAMNPTERATFIGFLPPPIFEFVRGLAKQVLSAKDDAKLEQALLATV